MSKLIQVEELFADKELAVKENELNILVNNAPPNEWVKAHPMVPGYKYLPVERVEWLLTMIFQKWRVEILSVSQLANSVVVTIRLFYKDPLTNEWLHQDGVGASPLQTNKGSGAVDWNQIKNAAVQMAAPAAESYAFKDAAEKIGRLFGKDLNRKDMMGYDLLDEKFRNETTANEFQTFMKQIEAVKDIDGLKSLKTAYAGKGADFDKEIVEKYSSLTKTV